MTNSSELGHLLPSEGMIFESGKTYTHSQGLSCCFRQWRASSHCRFLHGYALQVTLVFRTTHLDHRNWVMDFGGLKGVKEWLAETFDHKTLIARDDPEFNKFEYLHNAGLIQMKAVDHIGVESFCKMIYEHTMWQLTQDNVPFVFVQEVEVREHEGNFARYRRDS